MKTLTVKNHGRNGLNLEHGERAPKNMIPLEKLNFLGNISGKWGYSYKGQREMDGKLTIIYRGEYLTNIKPVGAILK